MKPGDAGRSLAFSCRRVGLEPSNKQRRHANRVYRAKMRRAQREKVRTVNHERE